MSDYIVYKAISPSNKLYIGITKNTLKERIYAHKTQAKKGRKTPFYDAMRKYKDKLIWEIIEIVNSLSKAEEKEKYYISLYNTIDRTKGYNLSPGGMAGSIMSEEGKKVWKEKMRKHYDDPEYIKMMSEKKKESLNSDPNSSEKQSSHTKKYYENKDNYKKHIEHLKKLHLNEEYTIKRAKSMGGKPFICVETGERFEYLMQAAKKFGTTCKDSIYKVLKGKRKTYKKLHFKYIEEV